MSLNQFIRSLSASQQVGALFLVVFGLLSLATVILVLLSLRERGRATDGEGGELRDLQSLLKTSWLMVVVFWVAWVSDERVAIGLFALVSFFVLREFISLSPTRRGDHRSLVLAFFVVLPLQYALV